MEVWAGRLWYNLGPGIETSVAVRRCGLEKTTKRINVNLPFFGSRDWTLLLTRSCSCHVGGGRAGWIGRRESRRGGIRGIMSCGGCTIQAVVPNFIGKRNRQRRELTIPGMGVWLGSNRGNVWERVWCPRGRGRSRF